MGVVFDLGIYSNFQDLMENDLKHVQPQAQALRANRAHSPAGSRKGAGRGCAVVLGWVVVPWVFLWFWALFPLNYEYQYQ